MNDKAQNVLNYTAKEFFKPKRLNILFATSQTEKINDKAKEVLNSGPNQIWIKRTKQIMS